MKVWEVGVSDCESSHTICICTTKELALREMFKKRDSLLAEWREMEIYDDESHKEFIASQAAEGIIYEQEDLINHSNTYTRMIAALSDDDYANWDNYPHEAPWIYETEVIEE